MSGIPPRRRWRRARWLAFYLALLGASHLVRWLEVRSAHPLPEQKVVAVPEVGGPGQVDIAYVDEGPASRADAPVVLLLHGSPAQAFDLRRLVRELRGSCRVIAPDLPGFGRSSRELPDYSFAAHAVYMRELLDALGVERVHVVGYSMGGGVGLLFYRDNPGRVASMTMLAALGVQEQEMLGDYTLNRSFHGLQLAVLWFIHEWVPHFGWLDDSVLNVAYARNFYDSDQRPLRAVLESFQPPMLIAHSGGDVLVPVAAAHEHYRIVPHSEWRDLPGGHIAVYRAPADVARVIVEFVGRVEAGQAIRREQATPERLRAAAVPLDEVKREPVVGLPLVILMLLIALGTLVSEDLACVAAGIMVAHGSLTYGAAAAAAFAGIFAGDILLYLAGRFIGRSALQHRPFRWMLSESTIEDSTEWFARRGPVVILVSRFVPGSRLPTFFAAGLLRLSLLTFALFLMIAGLLWAPFLVWLSSVLGERMLDLLHRYRAYTLLALAGAAVLLWLLLKLVIPLFTFRGRRLLVSSWRRLTRWEFWPPWLFYAPLGLYLAGLALRHRSATLFTAANPAMPAGGLLGESKAAILRGLAGASPWIARFAVVPADLDRAAKVECVRAFQAAQGIGYPLVLKPDVGQRGLGVSIVRGARDLEAYLETPRPALLAQEYIPGPEFGVFYIRHPGEPRGRIFAITDKRFPSVTGDGRQNLERLILRDPRAVCMARFYLHQHRDRLSWIPAPGEVVQLVELGTHCRGSLFLDGSHLATPALEDAVDRISRSYEGFFFGRYDVRASSVEEFQAGRGFKILELNGVTSEATSIYDPRHTLAHAYRTLAAQWRAAFAIGAAMRDAGRAQPIGWRALVKSLCSYRPAPEAKE